MSKEVVPFPKLQYLFMKMDYPFADDTLFRGNSDTLEFLKIQPDIETMYMMDRCGVFTRTKYRRLRGVRISERLVADAPKDIVARFVLEVSSHAQVLTIEDVTLGREFAMSVIRVKSLDQLQRLNMNNFNLTLCEIINMLRSLPSLTHLVSCEPELGYQFGELEVDDLGEYMLMAYYPLSKTFRSWTCCRLSTSTVDELSLCAILLAIACPRLSCASVGSIKFNEYCECVGEMMSEEPLASYLDLVEPLPQPRE
ncbi:hypothetical protein LPJ60_003469 [Coemansia sp. RSA 2675]|nr:hypothetical protein LPJ60_003469 [Coemansia sp. RSA 2675]